LNDEFLLCAVNPWWTSSRQKKGKEVRVAMKEKGGKRKRWRPRKCWFCEERHPKNDHVRPMERRDPEAWKTQTKMVKNSAMEKACALYEGERKVFDE
jgi:hypothetical protein